MKKLVSALLAGVMLISFASCDVKNKDSKHKTAKTRTVETGDKVDGDNYVSNKTTKISTDFTNMTAKVLGTMGKAYTDYLNIEYMDSTAVDKNKEVGVTSLAYVWAGEVKTDENDKPIAEHFVDMYFIEMDISSEQYSKLNVGDYITFYFRGCLCTKQVTAINGQFVLCVAVRDFADEQEQPEKTQPDFEDANVQTGYETFKNL